MLLQRPNQDLQPCTPAVLLQGGGTSMDFAGRTLGVWDRTTFEFHQMKMDLVIFSAAKFRKNCPEIVSSWCFLCL